MRQECLDENSVIRFFRGELSPPELSSFEDHIDGCSVCRVLVSSLAATQLKASSLSGADTVKASIDAASEDGSDDGPPSSLVPGTVLANRFAVEKLVGIGGMGQVFRGHDRETGTKVAIKLAFARNVEELRRFDREAKLLCSIQHPAIVRHIADGRDPDGTPYLVMEWLEGEDLASRLQRGPLDVRETIVLALRVSEALAAAHALGVVHRDIKPSNIFLRDGHVEAATVLDFGVARPSWHQATAQATRTGTLLGTLGYMAPEQALGAKTADARADIFSLGCVLFECLSGKRLFGGAHAVEVLANLLTQPVVHPRDLVASVPEVLDGLIVSMVERNPAARPADCVAVVAALQQVTAHGRSAAPPEPTSPWPGRLVVAVAALALAAAAICLAPRLRSADPGPSGEPPDPRVTAARAGDPAPRVADGVPSTQPEPPAVSSSSASASASAGAPSASASTGARRAPKPTRMDRPSSDPFGTFRN